MDKDTVITKSTVRSAVAAILAMGACAGAKAVDITTVPYYNILYISGSASIDPVLRAYWTNSIDLFCNAQSSAGGIDYYTGTGFTAVACASGLGAPVQPDTLIAFIKEDFYGSFYGVTAVNLATYITYPPYNGLTSSNCGYTYTAQTGLEQLETIHTFCTPTPGFGSHVSNLGFSDVEASLLGVSTANTTSFAALDFIFAPAVSLGLYHALQSIQGLNVNSEAVADVPTLTRGQLAAIYQGTLSSWTNVVNKGGVSVASQSVQFGNSNLAGNQNHICYDGTQFSTAADCQTGTLGPVVSPSSSTIYVCQRGQHSGEEQIAQVFFDDFGCAIGAPAFAGPSKPGTTCAADGCFWSYLTYGTVQNFAGSGTGDDLSCLVTHDDEGHFAISFASIDNGFGPYQSDVARKDFRYIRINGVMPSIENAAADKYQYWAHAVGYYPKQGQPNATTYGLADIVTSMTTGSGIATFGTMLTLNAQSAYTAPAFDGGFLEIPSQFYAIPNASRSSLATFRNNPVNSFAKANSAGVPQECTPPSLSVLAPDTADYPAWQAP